MLLKYSKTKLKNGFEIYHIPLNKGSDVISVDIFYKVGSRNETMGKSGIAHMLEHLNFKSTKNLKAGEFDNIVKGFGGVNNASTGFDYTHYFIKCSKKNLEKSIELYADIMSNLSLKDREFQPERNVVLEERLWRTDNNPIGFLYFTLFNEAFTYHPYHWTPIGFIEDIKNWTIDDIREFHATFYQPKNAFLLISGDIDKKSAFELGKKHFQDIKNTKELPKMHCIEPTQIGAKRAEIYKDSEVEMIAIAFKIPAFNHPDQTALTALSEYLSGGKSSALYKILVDEKQLANQIYAYSMDSVDENLFVIIGVCNPDVKAEALESEIKLVLDDVKQNKIDEDEMTRVKNSIKSDFIYSLSSVSKVANLYGGFIAKGDIKPLFEFEDRIKNLRSEEINEICKKYFSDKNSTTIILRKENR